MPPHQETIMSTTKTTLVRLGSARRLTRQETSGPYAEIGLMRSKTPI